MSGRWRAVALLLLVIEIGGIVWLVLNPSSATPTGAVLRVSAFVLDLGAPVWMASTTGWEYLLNLALFAPLGFLSSLIWDRAPVEAWVLGGFAISAGLELVQLWVLAGRSATLIDVSANTVGMFVGAVAAVFVLGVLSRHRPGGRRDAPF